MGVKESSSNEAMPRRWLRRASGALARRAAGAGAALARGRASVTHDDSAGGNGDVGVEGRHDLGLWRGERGVVEASNEVMRLGVGKTRKERARTARGASRCRAHGGHKMLQRAAAAQAAMVAPTQRIGAFAGGGVARDAEGGLVMSRRRQRRDGEALVRRAARAGAGLASTSASSSIVCGRARGAMVSKSRSSL